GVTTPRMLGTVEMLCDRAGPIRRFRADREEFPNRGQWTFDANPKKEFADPFAGQSRWATHRGNPQRTGADDGPGPKKPTILWASTSDDHYVAPLVPDGKALFASSLGGFNTPIFQSFALDPVGDKQVRWAKGAPLLRQPIAAAPTVVRGHTEMLVF